MNHTDLKVTLLIPFSRIFSVGVATAFSMITRLDRLMVATKNLVGEGYHLHGVGATWFGKNGGVEMGSRTNSLRPLRDA